MDKRGRDAEKRYRSGSTGGYKTVSLTLSKKIMNFLNKEVGKTEDKNMSQFIEESACDCSIEKMPKRRELNTFPIKKTFTFTKKFAKAIKKSGNMSLAVEHALINKFNIK